MNIYTRLTCFKKVYTKVQSKEYYLVKVCINLRLKEKKRSSLAEVEITYIIEVGSFNILNPHSLPLANYFAFNSSFLILPNIISNNTPIPFL